MLFRYLPALLLAALIAGCTGSTIDVPTPPGMQRQQQSGLDAVFTNPAARFSQYREIYIEQLAVSYDTSPRQDSLHRDADAFRLSESEQARLQQQFEKAVLKIWGDQPGWQQAATPGPGILVLRPEIKDFYLYASLKNEPDPDHVLTRESSRFKLVVQLVDGGTGEVLLESQDRRVTGETGTGPGTLRTFSSVRYWSDFYQDISRWALQMRKAITTG